MLHLTVTRVAEIELQNPILEAAIPIARNYVASSSVYALASGAALGLGVGWPFRPLDYGAWQAGIASQPRESRGDERQDGKSKS
jgi:hypothetical protein